MYIALYCVLSLISLGAVLLNLWGLPGNWIVLAAALVLSWYHQWTHPGVLALVFFALIILGGDIGEIMASAAGAKKFGAGKSAIWAAMLGGIIGAFVGVPVPVFGSILGALAGAFVGALLCELWRTRSLGKGTWAAVGAALGRMVGLSVRVACGFVVWLAVLIAARP